jgi:hypothetical protein
MVLLLAELGMEIEKVIRSFARPILLNCRLDDTQPEDRDRFVVAAGRLVGNIVGGVVGANPVTQLIGGNLKPVASQIKVRKFDVRAMMPLIKGKRTRFELLDKIVVRHGMYQAALNALLPESWHELSNDITRKDGHGQVAIALRSAALGDLADRHARQQRERAQCEHRHQKP